MSKSRLHEAKNQDDFKKEVYAKRRQKLLKNIDSNSIVILSAHPISHRNGDVEYKFRQDSNFYYLTGFKEPESVAVFAPGREQGEFILFNRSKDPKKEIWTGKRAGQEDAIKTYGADESYPINEFAAQLPLLLKNRTLVHYPINDKNKDKEIEKVILNAIKKGKKKSKITAADISHTINEMRQIKDDEEIALIKKSVAISEKAHLNAMKRCKPGLYEYQLEAELMHTFLDNKALGVSYPNIVASGENSCTLHYDENEKQIKEGELILIDAGGEYENYSSDITRTLPANGKFNKEQRAIYELVLKAQEAGIKAITPDSNWGEVEAIVCIVLTEGLINLGLLKGDPEKLVRNGACKRFYMHSSGHWMGLDVHDLHDDNELQDVSFKPGMVMTMEPGIYIKPSDNIDKRWHNIGVRIEDDILVTKNGCEVLSRRLPKTVAEIEAIMAEAQSKKVVEEKTPLSNTTSSTAKSFVMLSTKKLNPVGKESKNDMEQAAEILFSMKHPEKSKPLPEKHTLFKSSSPQNKSEAAKMNDEPIIRRLRPRKIAL